MKNFHLIQHRRNLIRGIVFVLFGGIMLFVPGITARLILTFLGTIFLLIGLSGIFFNSRKVSVPFRSFLHTESYISILIGLLLVIFPLQLTQLFSLIVGIGFLLMGIRQTVSYFQMGKYARASKIYIISALIVLLIGLYLLIFPRVLVTGLVWIIGAVMVVYGVNELLFFFQVDRNYKKASKGNIEDAKFEEL